MKRIALLFSAVAVALLLAAVVPQRVWSWSGDDRERSIAAFRVVATILKSPRCNNCHVVGDRPRQGDDRHLHAQNVMRGPDGTGLPGLRCSNCHQELNHESPGGPP